MEFMKTINATSKQKLFSFLALGLYLSTTIFYSQDLFAQATNRFALGYQSLGNVNGVSTFDVRAEANHRFLLDEEGENLLTTGIIYSHTELDDSRATGFDRSRELRMVRPDITLMRILNEEYSLYLSLRPAFYGDLSGSLGDDFRLEGGAVVTKLISDNLTMGLGLGRGSSFGRDLIVPLFQFVWFASEKVIVRGVLPIRASVWYIPNQDWEFGAIYKLQGGLYNIEGETNIAGAKRLGFAAAHIGGGARYRLFGNNFITAEAGVTALRRYQWDNESGTSIKISEDPWREREIDNVPYLNIGFIQKF